MECTKKRSPVQNQPEIRSGSKRGGTVSETRSVSRRCPLPPGGAVSTAVRACHGRPGSPTFLSPRFQGRRVAPVPAADPFYRGPLVVVTGRVAARLSRPLAGLLRQARDQGERLDEEVVATVSAIEQAGREYAASRVRAGSASGTSELDFAELPSGSDRDGLSTAEAADELGCSERWVTKPSPPTALRPSGSAARGSSTPLRSPVSSTTGRRRPDLVDLPLLVDEEEAARALRCSPNVVQRFW